MSDAADPDIPAVETRGLGKRFGARWAAQEVGLRVEAGVIYGFLGRNGAGKTTVMRLVLGLLRPSAGEVRVFGRDVGRERMAAARLMGSLLDAGAVYGQLTGRENLDCTRRLLGLPAGEIDRVLELVEMTAEAGRKVGHYSLGMRQRLGLARALLGSPRLLVLDEPMNGLDPDGIRDMRLIIRDLPSRCGATVLLSSHLLAEVQQTVTHVGLMQAGRLVMQGPIEDLLATAGPELFVRTNNAARTLSLLTAQGHRPAASGDGIVVALRGGDREAAGINQGLVEAGLAVAELSLRQPTLETLYLGAQSQEAAA